MSAPARTLDCIICLEPYSGKPERMPRSLPCGHSFCTSCIRHVLNNCPMGCPKPATHPDPKVNFALVEVLGIAPDPAVLGTEKDTWITYEEFRTVGAIFDVKDPDGKWYQAEIVPFYSGGFGPPIPSEWGTRVHYLGWHSKYDENFDLRLGYTYRHRFARAFTHTNGPHISQRQMLAMAQDSDIE